MPILPVAEPGPSVVPPAPARRWAAALALLLLVPLPTIGTLAAMVWPATQGTVGQAIYGAAKVLLLVIPVAWLVLVDRERPSLSPARLGGFGVAAGLGLAISAIIAVGYWLLGETWIDKAMIRATAAHSGIDRPLTYLGFTLYACLLNSVLEEYVWRWFVFTRCRTLVPFAGGLVAVGLSALLFTVHHVVALKAQFGWNVTVLASVGVFVGGAVWSWCYLRFRSIWPGYLSHLIVDVTIFAIGWKLIIG